MRAVVIGLLVSAVFSAAGLAREASGEQRQFTERIWEIVEKGSLEDLTACLEAGLKEGLTCPYNEVLRLACVFNRQEMAFLAIERGAELNAPDREEDLPINCAARCGHFKLAEELARRGARITAPAAAVIGDGARLGVLVAADPDLLDRTWHYDPFSAELSLLHLAALAGQVNSIQALVQLGADPEEDDAYGFSGLYRAAQQGHLEAVRALLQYDKRIDHANKYGWTPLIVATSENHADVVAFLREQGARYDLFSAIINGDLPRVASLVQQDPALLKAEVGQQRPLGWAVERDRTEIAAWLLGRGAEIDWRAPYGEESALQLAASSGREATVRLLIEKGADLNIGSGKDPGGTALHRAVWQGHEKIVRMLLQAGADMESGDNTDGTPLVSAVKMNRTAIAQLLLDAGAQVNGKGRYTPLGSAVWDGQVEMARLLLKHDADVDRAKSSDGSALHVAAERGYLGLVRLLFEHKPDWARHDPSALHIAVQCRYAERYEAYFAIVKLLVESGFPVNLRWRGWSPLQFARDPRMIKCLLACGADVNARTEEGQTPLHTVDRVENARALLDAGADLNAQDRNGETPLHQAIVFGDYPARAGIQELLLSRGAKVDVFGAAMLGRTQDVLDALKGDPSLATRQRPDGETLLNLAAVRGNLPLVRELVRLGAKLEASAHSWVPLHSAAAAGHAEVVQFLIGQGAKVDGSGDYGQRPLYSAAMHGYAAVLRLLLAQGADVNAQTAFKQTALMAAAEGGHLEAVKALVEAGADMPLDMLDYAAGRGCGAVVLYLLAKGADAKAKPGAYSSPLHDAASNGLPEVIRALVKAGADVNAVNERGETALDWAKSNGRHESVRALRQLGGLQAQQLLQLRTGQVAKLIPLLDDERFAVRQRAYRELRRFGATIAVLLRKAREEATSQQVRTQLDLLLKECEPAP